jgi:glucuronate isomerase
LFERFDIEVLCTTESPLDALDSHRRLQESSWPGRVITAFRPDPVVDPEHETFAANIAELAGLSGEDCGDFGGYLRALRQRREFFKAMGATSTDHGHPSARTAALSVKECERLYQGAQQGCLTAGEADLFRAQMLTEMALMSLDDGLVMQLHPGVYRNHNPSLFEIYGRDKGADIPLSGEFVNNLKPLLDRVGNHPGFSLILFTLDESTYARELAPLAGHYPALKLGPPWWFHDSPEGMLRYRQQVTETAGFYNTAGFNDDTRAFLSIPARHDVARRMDCRFLAQLVAEHRIELAEAQVLAVDLTYNLAKQAYRL